ncbi:MAG TPA: hypothetical protein VEO01_01590 [Pseudonocardiaceae bacterium]|nr:hypothetical protein [Pseudonocardiaceae bacterium]
MSLPFRNALAERVLVADRMLRSPDLGGADFAGIEIRNITRPAGADEFSEPGHSR